MFLYINYLLHLPKCLRSWTIGWSCQAETADWSIALVLALAVLLTLAAHRGDEARSFVRGVLATLVLLTVVTLGKWTFVWGEPVLAVWEMTEPFRRKVGHVRANSDARSAWVEGMSQREAALRPAVGLAAEIYRCAIGHRTMDDDPRIPRTEEEIGARCGSLWINRAALDTVSAVYRYSMPRAAGVEDPLQPRSDQYWDEGWRWSYESTEPAAGTTPPGSFTVTVAPDQALPNDWPRVTADERGLIRIARSAGTPPLTLSPVPDLQRLHECLQGIPAEDERRHRNLTNRYAWELSGMASALCPELQSRITRDPTTPYGMVYAIELPVGPDGSLRRLTEYRIQIDVDESLPSFGFSLIATRGFTRNYLMTPTGTVHVTTESRPATTSDPVALHCEVVIDASC